MRHDGGPREAGRPGRLDRRGARGAGSGGAGAFPRRLGPLPRTPTLPRPAPRPRPPALTEAHVARIAPHAGDPPPPGGTPLDEAGRLAVARELLAEKGDGPFWVLAYGSLIWKPAFEHVETRRVAVHGWRRAFCMDMHDWRATPRQPGLMMALARGGACVGLAYRMPDDDPEGRMLRLVDREVGYAEDRPWLRWVRARGEGGPIRALAFYCAPVAHPTLLHLPIETQAARIARAAGPAGSCAEYLHNTVVHLEALGIRDRYLWRLQALVAAEIEAEHAGRRGTPPRDAGSGALRT
ncbi:gamma-glutamylcyclotransferase [Albimonas pacifica]|uniref:gamma-glutamylcyclotransferase n=1 Tax=Albimonas pacifica TaxID=1114924 RepID=UPI0015A5F139|nr:gamma-glutamylcyclotransferase [Albimonas pacifica]